MADAKCNRLPLAVLSNRLVRKVCRLLKNVFAIVCVTFNPAICASSWTTISQAPTSKVSSRLGNLTIHNEPSLFRTPAFGRAPPKEEPGASSIDNHLNSSESLTVDSFSICRLACSSSLIEVHGGVAKWGLSFIKAPDGASLNRSAPMRCSSKTPNK